MARDPSSGLTLFSRQRRVSLDLEQAAASAHRAGVLMLGAGPGTGKTRVLTERFIDLVEEGWAPQSILCVSFTKTAATEMAERIAVTLGVAATDLKGSCRTFHSLGYQLLRANPPFFMDKNPVLGQDFQRSLIEQSLRPGVNVRDSRAYISLMKRSLVSPRSCVRGTERERALAEVYSAYQSKIKELGKIDFDDMIFEAVRLLERQPEILAALQAKYRHLMIDEFQDTNFCQQKLTQLIGLTADSVVLVGDINQSIYGFCGADCKVINYLNDYYPGHSEKILGTNYRAHASLIPTFKAAIRAPEGISKRLLDLMRSGAPQSASFRIEARLFDDKDQEAGEIIDMVRSSRCSLNDMAVLFRTNAQSRAFEDFCASRKVPYKSAGTGFYERSEVRLGLALLGLAGDPNYNEPKLCECSGRSNRCGQCDEGIIYEWALRRVVAASLPGLKGLGKKALDWCERMSAGPFRNPFSYIARYPDMTPSRRWAIESLQQKLSALLFTARERPGLILQEAYKSFNLLKWAADSDDPGDGDSWRQENLNELVVSASRFETRKQFLDYASSRFTYAVGRKPREVEALTLSTIHKAKGREWPTVFLAGVAHGVLPHKKAESEEEEDRLLFVGLSRARNSLLVTGFGKPSWYLDGALKGEHGFLQMGRP